MGKRKVDNRIRILIENGVAKGYRTMFVIVGNKSRDQVIYLHHMLSKTSLKQATVLWCYKKELALSSHRKKRMKQLKAKSQAGLSDANEDDPFEMFVSMTEIRYTYYKDTHKILGNTYKMCVIQDFESMTPNLLCRTIETVEGGGIICILLQSMTSLKQLFTLTMDIHSRFRTEAHQVIVPRFNERFLLSLASCPACMVLDDQLRILPISSAMREIEPVPVKSDVESGDLKQLKESIEDTPPVGILIGLCKTLDQAKVVLEFIMTITEKKLNTTVTLTAPRGRGKSAAMGIALASAITFGYSNIYVTSPSPENLNTFFEFLLKSLAALSYEEHTHYQVIRSNDTAHNKAVLKIIITRNHRQVVQYISPRESSCLSQAELVIIDEAAAIPLSLVKNLLGSYLVFMASTVSGYEGTGRSLSLKLIEKLREESRDEMTHSDKSEVNEEPVHGDELVKGSDKKRKLVELNLVESIRYKNGDFVEKWLNNLLCLEAAPPALSHPVPEPEACELYYVNKDTLFGYHKVSEEFLNKCVGLLVSSHYRNSPDDLQTLSDAPAHHLFVFTASKGAACGQGKKFPLITCVLQVSFEGKVSKKWEMGNKSSGDMIPWTIGSVFLDDQFPKLSGLRVVRIATHPELQGRGYGSKALEWLEKYYSGSKVYADPDAGQSEVGVKLVGDEEVSLLEETLLPRPPLLPLLSELESRTPEHIDYLGVAFGASPPLITFWKRAGFQCIYVSQVENTLTGEHTAIMLKSKQNSVESPWLEDFYNDFRRRFVTLLAGPLRKLECKAALSILMSKIFKRKATKMSFKEFRFHWSDKDQTKLEHYVRNQVDIHFIADIIPKIARMYFLNRLPAGKLKAIHMAVLCGAGLQRKEYGDIATEFNLTTTVICEQANRMLKTLVVALKTSWEETKVEEREENKFAKKVDVNENTKETVEFMEDLKEAVADVSSGDALKEKLANLLDPTQFEIPAKETEVDGEKSSTKKRKKKKLSLAALEDR